MTDFDDIMDDLFHGCALAAYLIEGARAGGEPCSELTRLRAYRYYEEALAEKPGRKRPESPTPSADATRPRLALPS